MINYSIIWQRFYVKCCCWEGLRGINSVVDTVAMRKKSHSVSLISLSKSHSVPQRSQRSNSRFHAKIQAAIIPSFDLPLYFPFSFWSKSLISLSKFTTLTPSHSLLQQPHGCRPPPLFRRRIGSPPQLCRILGSREKGISKVGSERRAFRRTRGIEGESRIGESGGGESGDWLERGVPQEKKYKIEKASSQP